MDSPHSTNRESALYRLRLVADRLISAGKTVSNLDNSEHQLFPLAISPVEGKSLRDWITKEKAAHTIEIGLAYGISALFACEGLLTNGAEDMRHVVIDPFQSTGFKDCGLQALKDAGVIELVEYFSEESQIVLPRFLTEGRSFDLAFVDGSHFFDRVFLDLIYLGRLVRPSGIIFVDDYQLPAIARAISFCTTNLGWSLEEVSGADEFHQWAVLKLPSEAIPRSFRDFIEF
jgi:predicted O-methyltransferase YrrM